MDMNTTPGEGPAVTGQTRPGLGSPVPNKERPGGARGGRSTPGLTTIQGEVRIVAATTDTTPSAAARSRTGPAGRALERRAPIPVSRVYLAAVSFLALQATRAEQEAAVDLLIARMNVIDGDPDREPDPDDDDDGEPDHDNEPFHEGGEDCAEAWAAQQHFDRLRAVAEQVQP